MEVELNFTDVTMAETNGVFDEVKKKMDEEFPHDGKWMIRTDLTIDSGVGLAIMTLNLYYNKRVDIVKYDPSIGDVYYNPDLQSLSQWCQENGWNIPQPKSDIIKINKEFWKYFYDTLIIDSDYFDKIYGKRPQLDDNTNK